ncbi:hypothetical protein H2198_007398 [Neophaeococcomyces mojaviensis]|uniref:Uncharacterized protein n=1 Tax=Neophaeococcomyces mojaviensis TaxID=3383035 RepID=A0ACC3A047_9EURO|nr:hypothetical protein H2198_007398 [Knufia sp. JES_112]
MFVTTRDTGDRRRNRVYSTNKAARSSKLSLLTFATTSSGGSNSTVTQESYNRSQSKTSHRRKRPREHRSRSHRTQGDHDRSSPKAEVFDYLVMNETEKAKAESEAEDEPQVEPESDSSSDEETASVVPEVILHVEEEEPEGYYRSMSDSGISMGSSSSGRSVAGCVRRSHLPVLPEEPASRPASSHQHSSELALMDPRCAWHSSSPGPYPEGYIPPPVPQPPQIVYDNSLYPPYPYPSYETHSPSPDFYSHIPSINIREPSRRKCKPECFRSFTKISARLLLQLQDEIAEMEEEITMLDEESDSADDASEHGSSPSRQDIQASRARREHLYGELHMKLDQYCKDILICCRSDSPKTDRSVEMMQKIDEMSRPADHSETSRHQAWLESRIFPSSKIPRLAQDDLRIFKDNRPNLNMTPKPSFQLEYLIYTTLINTVLPLLMFKLIHGVLNRLILLSIVIIIGASVQDRTKTKVTEEDRNCTILCVCVSVFAAICL